VLSLEKIQIYMEMAHSVKKLSPDEETKVGAIMLSNEDRIVASSYNGFLRGAIDSSLPKTRPEKYTFIQHAERNILYNCAYEGIKTRGSTIICTLSPCEDCLRAAYQSGVKTIIFDELYHKFASTDFYKELPDVEVSVRSVGQYTVLDMESKKEAEEWRTVFGDWQKLRMERNEP
jgi:dCMP deaminase